MELKTNGTYRYDPRDSGRSLAVAEAILNSNKFALAARAFYYYIKYRYCIDSIQIILFCWLKYV